MHKAIILATALFSAQIFATDFKENQIDNGKVNANGKPVTLLGNGVKVGQQAPDFKVVDGSFVPVTLTDFKDKAVLISVVPSLDTGICSLQTKHFNEKVAGEFGDVVMLTISADLPFAQKRFCQTEGIDKIQTLSDSVWHDFGKNYGLYIKDMGLLSRAVFVLNKEHKIVYKQLVENLATEPNYDQTLAALKAL
ncbi:MULTISPECIES: thiol peroxidase [Pseudoalteromonas]|uniref:Lipid hydroperoxide peroxidase n=1 Tax=Pseudoalteromonas amylolytica TaxID=1859457 RepID=A0A1S1MW89_9GAMM|nr:MULTISPECIES: thiol peroxidase [Pseudoalteromonas]MCF6435122.1 thiol peroxidase [Pseudoalteromonas sp. MMG022]OHU87737.1 lipid hydroperoxide peroxidase [Pseudoalteromonas sp. JW3]OHU91179.1 lipid hydroperoxide peroxidase [Pseudoalteromonas amylolytica]